MSTRPGDIRREQITKLRAQRDNWLQELRDQDWLDRVAANADFIKLTDMYRDSMKNIKVQLENLKDEMIGKPHGEAELMRLKQQGLIWRRDLENCEAFCNFPAAESRRLDKIRDHELPKLEQELKELEKREESYA